MDLQLAGRRAVITGGSRGIGNAIAWALAAEGCHLGLVGRDANAAQAAAGEIAAKFVSKAIAITADTGVEESVQAMAADATAALGGVDILVNCAATPNIGDALREENLAHELNVKAIGYLRCARAFAPGMAANGWGRIISVAGLAARSAGGVVGSVRNVAVAATMKNLADELGPSGINVTVVHPAFTLTEQTSRLLAQRAQERGRPRADIEAEAAAGVSIGRLVTADEVASVVAFLASPLSVAITGDSLGVGGGAKGSIYY